MKTPITVGQSGKHVNKCELCGRLRYISDSGTSSVNQNDSICFDCWFEQYARSWIGLKLPTNSKGEAE